MVYPDRSWCRIFKILSDRLEQIGWVPQTLGRRISVCCLLKIKSRLKSFLTGDYLVFFQIRCREEDGITSVEMIIADARSPRFQTTEVDKILKYLLNLIYIPTWFVWILSVSKKSKFVTVTVCILDRFVVDRNYCHVPSCFRFNDHDDFASLLDNSFGTYEDRNSWCMITSAT